MHVNQGFSRDTDSTVHSSRSVDGLLSSRQDERAGVWPSVSSLLICQHTLSGYPPSMFLNCDWGTTHFRLRLVKTPTVEILAEVSSPQGAGSLSQLPRSEREQAFHDILAKYVEQIMTAAPSDHGTLPVMISGMASSSIGWQELPYARTPFSLGGENLVVCSLQGSGPLERTPLFLFSGVRSDTDVMRGEETELIGLNTILCEEESSIGEYLAILPGTHSKHVRVQQGVLTSFHTCLTGELFHLLGEKSSLRHSRGTMSSRPVSDGIERQQWDAAFLEAVDLSRKERLIQSIFQVRTRQLLGGATPLQSGGFLSGLLIGSELQTLLSSGSNSGPIMLAASPELARPYQLASECLGVQGLIRTIEPAHVTRLSALGQARVLPQLLQSRLD